MQDGIFKEAGGPLNLADLNTQIGWQSGRKGSYRQTRQWGYDSKLIKVTDWTNHGRPKQHTSPHDHFFLINPTGGSPIRGPEIPFRIIQE
jgi:hypothetical protein